MAFPADMQAEAGRTSGAGWTATADTTVDSLLAVAGWTEDELKERGKPWVPGHGIHYSGIGGMRIRDNRHVTIAVGGYTSHVGGDRTLEVEGDVTFDIDSDTMFSTGPSGAGSDRLHVKGNMHWHAHDKLIIGTGTVNRTWYGPVKRLVPMEGIICGGAYVKAFLGTSTTIGAFATGDVFGGAARTSASRTYVSGIGYRSTDNALWQLGLYARSTYVTLEPLIGSPSGTKPFNGSSHVARMAARISMAVLPFLSILVGVITFPIALLLAIGALVSYLDVRFFAAPPPKPPPTLPRVRNRTVGLGNTMTGSLTET